MNEPLIKFVNHASVIFSYKKINLITDPWIFGSAFNNSWDLISDSKMKISDFDQISHIWFSHEHPDHFYPKVLASIPEETRKNITILFQNTLDHRVVRKCKELGFSIVEMKNNKFYNLDSDFRIKCKPYLLYDSMLLLEIGNKKILNLNDCGVDSYRQAKYIHSIFGDVDLILTQFGYAAHIGDPHETELRKIASQEKLTRIKIQSEIFSAKYIIPFASFILFSHEDNFYMNDHINKIGNVEQFILNETSSIPIVLYPGDEWIIGDVNNNAEAISLYDVDFSNKQIQHKNSAKVSFDELSQVCNDYVKTIRKRNNWTLIKFFHWLSFFKTSKIYLKDLEVNVSFDLIHGLKISNFSKEESDIITDSDSLAFAFKFDYGADTLLANARFRKSGGKTMVFFRQFMIGTLNNNGRTFPFGIIGFLLRERSMWKSLFLEVILGKYDFE